MAGPVSSLPTTPPGHPPSLFDLALRTGFDIESLVFAAFVPLSWNPIYPGIVAMLAGAALTVWCRPDLPRSTLLGGGVFVLYYALFMAALEWTSPGYVEQVWKLDALSGVRLGFMPLEELLFAPGFGAYWAGVYEHYTWRSPVSTAAADDSRATAAS